MANVTLDTVQLARLLNMDPRSVRRLKADGVLFVARNEFGTEMRGRYEMIANNHAYIAYLKKLGRWDASGETQRLLLTNRKIAADAELSELRLLQVKGTLHRSVDVEFLWTSKLTRIKARMQAIPSRVSRLLVGKTDFREIHDLLTAEVDMALRECSGYNSADFQTAAEEHLTAQGAGLEQLEAETGPSYGNGEVVADGAEYDTD